MKALARWFRVRRIEAGSRLRVRNLTRGTELSDRAEVASTARLRNRGLLGRAALEQGEGMWIVPCSSVHTFFMRFPIDLVYLDRRKRVMKVRREVPAWRISVCLLACSVLELPAGAVDRTSTARGDQMGFLPAAEELEQ